MSQENVEIVRRGFEHFQATGESLPEFVDPEFVWDMSTFRGWPERSRTPGSRVLSGSSGIGSKRGMTGNST